MKQLRAEVSSAVYVLLLAFLLIVWSWVLHVDATLITASSIASHIVRIMTLVVSVGVSVLIFWKAINCLKRDYDKSKKDWRWLIRFFFLWAFIEWLVAWAVSVIWFGNNASFDSVYPFGSLSPSLAYTPFLFASRFVGFYGLSSLFVTLGISLFAPRLRHYWWKAALVILIFTFFGWFTYQKPSGPEITVTTTAERLAEFQKINTEADLVVFGEYAMDDYREEKKQYRINAMDDQEVYFVGSQQTPANPGIHNTMLFASTEKGLLLKQDKNRLIPGGEYLPYSVEALLTITRQTGALAEFDVLRAVQKGDGTVNKLVIRDDFIVGAEVCSSIVSTEDYRKLAHEDATILTNSASLGVFGGSRVYRISHNGMARFMAVANARPFVQSAQDEAAYIIDHNGNEVLTISPVGQGTQDVVTNQTKTIYTIIGDWPVYVGAGIALSLTLGKIMPRNRAKASPHMWYNKRKQQKGK